MVASFIFVNHFLQSKPLVKYFYNRLKIPPENRQMQYLRTSWRKVLGFSPI